MDPIREHPVFAELDDRQFQQVRERMEEIKLPADALVFHEGDADQRLMVLTRGVVQIVKRIFDDVEKTLLTLRDQGVFGEMSLVSGMPRSASARTASEVELLSLPAEAYESLLDQNPAAGLKIQSYLLRVAAGRLGDTTERYRENCEWSMRVSGLVEMNYSQLIAENTRVTIELTTGKAIAGDLLKIERGALGVELFVKTTSDQHYAVIPYHAVACMSFNRH